MGGIVTEAWRDPDYYFHCVPYQWRTGLWFWEYSTEEVPFQTLPDGRRYLTTQQIASDWGLKAFVGRFPHCFTQDPNNPDIYIYTPPAG